MPKPELLTEAEKVEAQKEAQKGFSGVVPDWAIRDAVAQAQLSKVSQPTEEQREKIAGRFWESGMRHEWFGRSWEDIKKLAGDYERARSLIKNCYAFADSILKIVREGE